MVEINDLRLGISGKSTTYVGTIYIEMDSGECASAGAGRRLPAENPR
jgi:hypothetical protein